MLLTETWMCVILCVWNINNSLTWKFDSSSPTYGCVSNYRKTSSKREDESGNETVPIFYDLLNTKLIIFLEKILCEEK